MKNGTMATILLLLSAVAIAAGAEPKFEVATLKQSPPPPGDSYSTDLGTLRSGRLYLTNVTLSDCIKFAWGLVADDQIYGSDWIKSKSALFYIVAQVPPGTPRDQLLLMTQSLLADRLQLSMHHEQKDLRYIELIPARGGPKLTPADPLQQRNNSGGSGRLTGNQVSMQVLATMLSRLERILVVDRTGLAGEYQINLRWIPGSGGPEMARDDAAGASLFTASQEQLGLKLESRKGPLDVLVVDRAAKIPADN